MSARPVLTWTLLWIGIASAVAVGIVAGFLILRLLAPDVAIAASRPVAQPTAPVDVSRTSGDCWVRPTSQARNSRVAWRLANGPIPDGMLVCHTCDNPPCCNPLHLFLGTAKDNAADMVAKGRNRHGDARGMRHPNSKLTDDAVRQIRAAVAVGEPKRAIARRFGVNDRLIYMILDGSAWSHVK